MVDAPHNPSARDPIGLLGQAATDLLPVLYDELRQLARSRLARLPAGGTLQATDLVHEAFLRLIGDRDPGWKGRNHFFGAAARAMRQILVERSRRKASRKHGGGAQRIDLNTEELAEQSPAFDVLALDEALERLEKADPVKAQIVMLRCFAGLSREESADVLGISTRTLDRAWRYIVARLNRELAESGGGMV